MRKKSVNDLARDWWLMGLRGLAALVACVIFLVTPLPRADNLLRVFGGYLLTDGIILLVLTILEIRHRKSWAKSALSGVLGVIFGITNLIGSGPVMVRAVVIAIRTFVTGVSSTRIASQLHVPPSERLLAWLLALAGIGSVIFSLIISVGPLLLSHLLDRFGWVAVLYTFCLGILFLILSLWLFKLNQQPAQATAA
ncbi:MAG TPA: DUF308 domain-containing protein [Ktedonobacterales bacterium]|nr:DUF308 domain-containing protein [Ktedonobacterales bacterium]